jgi:cell division protein FtsQ
VAKRKDDKRNSGEPAGLWHQPALMNMLADLLIVLATAGLAWTALIALQRLPVFPLRELALTQAPTKLTVEQLEHVMRTGITGNFFTVDLDATRDAFEKLPWVRKATVQRQWPGGLTLTIEEHEVRARWRHLNGNPALVNRQGEVFVAELQEHATLPLFSGPEGSTAEILRQHEAFTGVLAGIGRRADTIALSPRQAWQVKLDDGVTIELGRDQEQHPLGERLSRFAAYYPTLKSRMQKLQVADMRYPNGFVVSSIPNAGGTRPPATAGRKS